MEYLQTKYKTIKFVRTGSKVAQLRCATLTEILEEKLTADPDHGLLMGQAQTHKMFAYFGS